MRSKIRMNQYKPIRVLLWFLFVGLSALFLVYHLYKVSILEQAFLLSQSSVFI